MTNPYENRSDAQLEGTIKTQKILSIAIAAVSIPLIGLSLYSMFFQDDGSKNAPLLVVGISCFAMVPVQLLSMKKMKEELARRAANDTSA